MAQRRALLARLLDLTDLATMRSLSTAARSCSSSSSSRSSSGLLSSSSAASTSSTPAMSIRSILPSRTLSSLINHPALVSSPEMQRRSLHRSAVVCAAVKSKTVYQCSSCEATAPQKKGKCPECGEWGTMEAVVVRAESSSGSGGGGGGGGAGAAAAAAAVSSSSSSSSSLRVGSSPVAAAPTSSGRLPARASQAWVSPTSSAPQSLAELNEERERREAGGGGGSGGSSLGNSWRLRLPGPDGAEVARVLGGVGAVPGSLTLVGGDPGVGKSTLLLQVAAMLSGDSDGDSGGKKEQHEKNDAAAAAADDDDDKHTRPKTKNRNRRSDRRRRPVLYVSAEESVDQVANRAARLGLGGCANLLLLSATRVEDVLRHVVELEPAAVVVDSIQTVYLDGAPGSAGSVTQVRECAAALLRVAKDVAATRGGRKKNGNRRKKESKDDDDDENNENEEEEEASEEEDLSLATPPPGPAIFLVGHVTKSGDVAGPRVLEHIVDAVLYLEGERGGELRLLRAVKNRFGPADEVGVFRMGELGLSALPDPSAALAAEREAAPSVASVATVAVEGTRPMLLEVQALVSPSSASSNSFAGGSSPPVRAPGGVRRDRLALILAVLAKHARLRGLGRCDVHANVVGGLELREPAADVAVAAALAASAADNNNNSGSSSFSSSSSGGSDDISGGPRTRRDVCAFGEVGLGGELRRVPHIGARLAEAAKLGFRAAVVPASQEIPERALAALREIDAKKKKNDGKGEQSSRPMEIVKCRTVVDALGALIEWPGSGSTKSNSSGGGSWRGRRRPVAARKGRREQREEGEEPFGEEEEDDDDEASFA